MLSNTVHGRALQTLGDAIAMQKWTLKASKAALFEEKSLLTFNLLNLLRHHIWGIATVSEGI